MNMKKYILDFTNVKKRLEMHGIFKEVLEFPDYYGCNWDAFWDCITDMYGEPMHIEIIGIEAIERKFDGVAEKMIEIFREFKREDDEFLPGCVKIDIIREDGTVTIVD